MTVKCDSCGKLLREEAAMRTPEGMLYHQACPKPKFKDLPFNRRAELLGDAACANLNKKAK